MFCFGDDQVVLAERDAGLARLLEAERHQPVAKDHGLLLAAVPVNLVDDIADLFLRQQLIDHFKADRRHPRQNLGQQHAARGRLDPLHHRRAIGIDPLVTRLDVGMQRYRFGVERLLDFADAAERHSFALFALTLHRDVIEAEDDILRRHNNRLAVGRRKDVVRRHHQNPRLELRLERQRHVDRHLVAVEIGVERGADERVQLDRLAFDQHRLERLNPEPVQGRRAVQQHRMLADDLLQYVPDFWPLLFDHAFCRLDRAGEAVQLQFGIDERLEQLERHLLRQAALVQFELRSDDDDRAAGIVDPLAQQVLAEAALLALQHVGERLQGPLVGPGDDPSPPTVIEQRVDRLLQHALLVAHDDVGRAQLDQALQAVVAVDHASIEIIQIGGREAAAIERHERPQLRWDHRDHVEDHPFRPAVRIDEGFD